MNNDDVEIHGVEPIYDGFFRMNRYRLRHRLFTGGWSQELTREIFERDPVAAVLPYDPQRDEVVLIEQFRPGPAASGTGLPWVVEIVAGIIETGESAEDLVRREAIEEADCVIGELVPIAAFSPSPGGSTEHCRLFCGRTSSAEVGGIHGHAEEGEDIRAFVEPVETAYARIAAGEIDSAFSIIALQWLMLNREELRARWA